MDSFALSARALDLVARFRVEAQGLDSTEVALLRERFGEAALALCEAHFDSTDRPAVEVGPPGATAGLESPTSLLLHRSAQAWLAGATFAMCGRRLGHPIPPEDQDGFAECTECFGHRPLSHPQILTRDEADRLPAGLHED